MFAEFVWHFFLKLRGMRRGGLLHHMKSQCNVATITPGKEGVAIVMKEMDDDTQKTNMLFDCEY